MKVEILSWRFGLSQVQGSDKGLAFSNLAKPSLLKLAHELEKRTKRISDTLSKLRTQLTPQLAKSRSGAGGLASRQAAVAKASGGFSVVELILSIVVGGLFLLALTQITNNYIIIGQKSRDVVLSNSYVEAKIETLRNIGFSGLSNGTTSLTGELPAQLHGPKSASMVITTPSTNLKQVDLTLTYSDRGTGRTATYRTYIGEISDLQ